MTKASGRRVKDVVVRDVVFVNPGDSLSEVLDLMVENRVSALPVIDGHRRCVGFLSVTDFLGLARDYEDVFANLALGEDDEPNAFLRQLRQPDLGNRRVRELMSETSFAVSMEASLQEAAREMARHRVHRLAVVDKDQKLMGIVSTMDIVHAVADGALEG